MPLANHTACSANYFHSCDGGMSHRADAAVARVVGAASAAVAVVRRRRQEVARRRHRRRRRSPHTRTARKTQINGEIFKLEEVKWVVQVLFNMCPMSFMPRGCVFYVSGLILKGSCGARRFKTTIHLGRVPRKMTRTEPN